jgi:hypothetical protein
MKAIGLFLLIVSLILAFRCDKPAHPSDSELESNFRQHEKDFQRLVAMSNGNPDVVRISFDFTWLKNNVNWPRPESEWGLSKERWDSYRQLFKELGLNCGLSRRNGTNVIELCASATGTVTSGTDKGYAYSETELAPTVPSLDNVPTNLRNERIVYKKLETHWYLYYWQG